MASAALLSRSFSCDDIASYVLCNFPEMCAICLEAEPRVELICGHGFCEACLTAASRTKGLAQCCPVCRARTVLSPAVLRERAASYRNDYSSWRKGAARGAKGELSHISTMAVENSALIKLAKEEDVLKRKMQTAYGTVNQNHHQDACQHIRTLSTKSTVLTNVNFQASTSILVAPYLVARTGWLGVGVVGALMLVSHRTALWIGESMHQVSETTRNVPATYPMLAGRAAGMAFGAHAEPRARAFVATVQLLELASYVISCVTVGGEALLGVALSCGWTSCTRTEATLCGAVVTAFAIMLPSPSRLTVFALTGTFIFYIVYGVQLVATFDGGLDTGGSVWKPKPTRIFTTAVPFISSAGAFAYSFAGHTILPAAYAAMKTPCDFGFVVDVAFGITGGTMLLMGVCGYLAMGDGMRSELLEHYFGDAWLRLIANVLMALKFTLQAAVCVEPLAYEVLDSARRVLHGGDGQSAKPLRLYCMWYTYRTIVQKVVTCYSSTGAPRRPTPPGSPYYSPTSTTTASTNLLPVLGAEKSFSTAVMTSVGGEVIHACCTGKEHVMRALVLVTGVGAAIVVPNLSFVLGMASSPFFLRTNARHLFAPLFYQRGSVTLQ